MSPTPIDTIAYTNYYDLGEPATFLYCNLQFIIASLNFFLKCLTEMYIALSICRGMFTKCRTFLLLFFFHIDSNKLQTIKQCKQQ